MNVEATSIAATQTSETSSSSSINNVSKDGTSFKDELAAKDIKAAQTKETEAKEQEALEVKTQETQATDVKNTKSAEETAQQKIANNKFLLEAEETVNLNEDDKVIKSLSELNSQIAVLNDLKTGFNKTEETKTEKASENCSQVLKMDTQDAAFFLSLTENQQMTVIGSPISGQNSAISFTDIKSEATQKTVQVSQTLLNALNESAKTNQPFRIDFDNDISVIMKVDKEGKLSANFIPGTAAVEAYLKNNIAGLKQNFENQNIAYNELSYSERRKENQQDKQQKNKEKDNE